MANVGFQSVKIFYTRMPYDKGTQMLHSNLSPILQKEKSRYPMGIILWKHTVD